MLSPKEFSFHQCCSALKKGSNLTVRSLLNTGPEDTNFRRQEIALWVSSPLPIRTGVHRVQVLHAFFTRAQWLFSGCLFNCRMYIWRVFHKWHLQQLGECPFSLLVPTLYIHPRNKTMITAYVKPSPEKPRKKNNNY